MESVTLAYVLCITGIILCVVWLVRLKDEKRKREDKLTILREWLENGQRMKNWLKGHLADLNKNPSATVNHPEFQTLLWRDFDLYRKVLIFYPDIQENQELMEGRLFFEKLIATSGKPS